MKRATIVLLVSLCAIPELFAQRIPAVASNRTVVLTGIIPPASRTAADQGPVDPTMAIRYVSLIFRRTAAQQLDLDQLTAAQRRRESTDLRRWLKPADYADRFGLDPASLANVRAWLESKGFSIDREAASHTWIAFSGTAAQIDNAFHTALHIYAVGGKTHFAPTNEPSIPESWEGAILSIRGLDDFVPEHVRSRTPVPGDSGGTGTNALTPGDLAIIYDIAPLYAARFTGAGQSIAIIGASSIDLSDLSLFRSTFGLPAKTPTLVAVADPDIPAATGAQGEAMLDLQVSAAIAPDADQIFVYATNIEDAFTYVIDNALAPVLSMSFLACENDLSQEHEATLASLGQEAAAKGITWIVAAGDSGPAACDRQAVIGTVAQGGINVNGYAAIPEVTAVGGTEFDEDDNTPVVPAATTGPTGPFWNGVNGPGLASATGYIPETAWNDSNFAGYLVAGGGGSSHYFSKPSWQSGAAGVPNDGSRDVPDVALASSANHDGYYICSGGVCGGGHGGTSAATPLFAGLTALLNQFLLKQNILHVAGLGNINPTLYQLAQIQRSPTPAFHDIVTGSNTVPCLIGTPDCSTGSYGYPAGPNYDLATGLGSVDATQLFSAWLSSTTSLLKPTSMKLSAPTSTGISQMISATVSGANGTAPTGTVVMTAGATSLGSASLARGSGSSTATFTIFNSQLPEGITTIAAFYTGNSEFLPSANTTTVSELPASAMPSVQVEINPDPVHETPTAYGNSWNLILTLREVNGAKARLVGLKLNRIDTTQISPQTPLSVISGWFGATTLQAFGTISVPLQITASKVNNQMTVSAVDAFGSGAGIQPPASSLPAVQIPGIKTPAALTVEIDIPGPTPTAPLTASTATVPLLARPSSAQLQLTGVPSVVLSNPSSSGCPWAQSLLLRELSGTTGVTLTQFTAGGTDMSGQIGLLFGATHINPGTELTAPICWSGVSAPILINYEIAGNDDVGNTVSAAMTSSFLNQPSSPTSLTVTSPGLILSGTLNLNSLGGPIVFQVTPSSSTQVWTTAIATSGQSPGWLTISPISGMGVGSVYVAPASGLTSGTYNATIIFQSADSEPQTTAIPVTFAVK